MKLKRSHTNDNRNSNRSKTNFRIFSYYFNKTNLKIINIVLQVVVVFSFLILHEDIKLKYKSVRDHFMTNIQIEKNSLIVFC